MELKDFPNEILNKIKQYLSYVDIMSLRFTCKLFNNSINVPDINELVMTEFLKFTNNRSDILDAVRDYHYSISGSFILKLLYNAEWKNNDIDIYIKTENSSDWLFNKLIPNSKVQIIYLENISTLKFIFNTFDIDLLMVAYHENKLYIKDWNLLISRDGTLTPQMLMYISTYSNCYGRFKNKKEELKESCLNNVKNRRNKYIKRDFNISLHPKYKEFIDFDIERFLSYKNNYHYFNDIDLKISQFNEFKMNIN
jgi:hypothetical protein